MLPLQLGISIRDTEIQEYADRTYRIDIDENRITGQCDDLDAVRQAVYLILRTEKGVYPIYSDSYGLQTEDLFGKAADYAMSVLPERIKRALLQDGRIHSVDNFAFHRSKHTLLCSFNVSSSEGNITITDEEVTEIV